MKNRKEDKEEYSGGKYVHPYRVQVACAPPPRILGRQKSRPGDEEPQGVKKLSIEVRDVVKKMYNQVPGGFFGFDIFLSANVAIRSMQGGITI
jgi:hypothetical protein